MEKKPWYGKSVLIVDDSNASQEMLRALFESAGFRVIGTLSSCIEALQFVEKKVPDYISLDIIMPEMDGIECYIRLKETQIQSTIFLVSALSSEARVVGAYSGEIPPAAFLPKPLDLETLEGHLMQLSAADKAARPELPVGLPTNEGGL